MFGIKQKIKAAAQDIRTALYLKTLPNSIVRFKTREDLISTFKPQGTGCELGVHRGFFSESLLKFTNPKTLYLVDPWPGGAEILNHAIDLSSNRKLDSIEGEECYREVLKKFGTNINIKIERKYSEVFLNSLPDHSLDWIYIDSTHTYNSTKKELQLAEKKVKPDGIIAGHDYCYMFKGVLRAVDEFAKEHDWKLSGVTTKEKINPSFLLRKIKN